MHIAIFCGASDKALPEYKKLAFNIGSTLGAAGHNLVYGGGISGLMGEVSKGFRQHGATVLGVTLKEFHSPLDMDHADEMVIALDIIHRKTLMCERAEAYVVLPGSFGTFDEVTWVMAEAQYGTETKPIICVTDFFSPVKDLIERMIEARLAPISLRDRIQFVETPEEVLAALH
jgi:hypothetical protein